MPTTDPDYYRPEPEHRWIGGRTEPATIQARTRYLYSEPDDRTMLPEGRTRWAFGRGADVTDGGEFASTTEHHNHLAGYLDRMVSAFGDDADLIIEVRLANPKEAQP